jgi:hypothetical protein
MDATGRRPVPPSRQPSDRVRVKAIRCDRATQIQQWAPPLWIQGVIVEPVNVVMMNIIALLASALLVGGRALYSFGFAPLVFSSLPADTAGSLLRRAFAYYYLFVLITAAVAAISLFARGPLSSALMAVAALIAAMARQILMPAISTARDASEKQLGCTGYPSRSTWYN